MPQLNKGGKFVFGLSVIHENRSVQIPPQAINEYRLSNENKIIIFTGSKITGGFCVTSYPLLSSSKLSHILKECPTLNDSSIFPGTLIHFILALTNNNTNRWILVRQFNLFIQCRQIHLHLSSIFCFKFTYF